MLTGKHAFEGEDVSDTLANILKSEPDWTALPTETPVAIRTLLRRSLARDRKQRLDSATAVRLELEGRLEAQEPSYSTPSHTARLRRVAAGLSALVLLTITGLAGFVSVREVATNADTGQRFSGVNAPSVNRHGAAWR
jgi:serine/threonine protein kinase